MSNIPDFISSLTGDGDGYNYAWVVRVDQAGNQFLYDLMGEWNTGSKSEMLRGCISFTAQYLPTIASMNGKEAGIKIAVRAELIAARAEMMKRKGAAIEVKQAYMEAMSESHEPTKNRLLEAAKKYAGVYGIEWPPKSIDLLHYDSDARYVHNRVLSILRQSGEPRVSLRELTMGSVGNAEHVLETLRKLEAAEHVILEEEKRSGPPTIWVSVPTLVMNC